jgi:hypothetical protein
MESKQGGFARFDQLVSINPGKMGNQVYFRI